MANLWRDSTLASCTYIVAPLAARRHGTVTADGCCGSRHLKLKPPKREEFTVHSGTADNSHVKLLVSLCIVSFHADLALTFILTLVLFHVPADQVRSSVALSWLVVASCFYLFGAISTSPVLSSCSTVLSCSSFTRHPWRPPITEALLNRSAL